MPDTDPSHVPVDPGSTTPHEPTSLEHRRPGPVVRIAQVLAVVSALSVTAYLAWSTQSRSTQARSTQSRAGQSEAGQAPAGQARSAPSPAAGVAGTPTGAGPEAARPGPVIDPFLATSKSATIPPEALDPSVFLSTSKSLNIDPALVFSVDPLETRDGRFVTDLMPPLRPEPSFLFSSKFLTLPAGDTPPDAALPDAALPVQGPVREPVHGPIQDPAVGARQDR